MQTRSLNRVGVVVYDLAASTSEYERIYGITDWDVQEVQAESPVSYGRKNSSTPGTWRSAVGSTKPVEGERGPGGEDAYSLTFELIQPIAGESPFMEHLRTKREGICFIQVSVDEEANVDQHFRNLGIAAAYSANVGETTRTFYDTRDALGGFLVEMVSEDAITLPPTKNAPLLPTQGMYHFGVLVHDVMKVLPAYRDIFGLDRFEMKTWETGFGRLDRPQYRGEQVEQGYFTAQAFPGNFGFEIIQSNHGPSHYNREFFDIRGPGIHHIFSWMTTEEDKWEALTTAMTQAGHPLCMGSTLRGEAAEFGYFDTFESLGGYLVEVVIRRRTPEPEFASPDWVIEFEDAEK